MLVIRRKAGEVVRIGEEIEVEVLELSASRVVLGIRAPGDVRVTRKELIEAGERNRAAAETAKTLEPGKISSYLTDLRR